MVEGEGEEQRLADTGSSLNIYILISLPSANKNPPIKSKLN